MFGGSNKKSEGHLSCRQRMTRADPGGTLPQNSWRSSKQASASGTSKRMSLDAYSMIFCTRAEQAGDWISSLHNHPDVQESHCHLPSCIPPQ